MAQPFLAGDSQPWTDLDVREMKNKQNKQKATPWFVPVLLGCALLYGTFKFVCWTGFSAFQDTTEVMTKSGPAMRFQINIAILLVGTLLGLILIYKGVFPNSRRGKKEKKH